MFTHGRHLPAVAALAAVCEELAARADRTAIEGPWRSGSVATLARHGMLAGFVPADCGGTEASEAAISAAFVAIAGRCLTTALALTQWASAVRIIASGPPSVRAARLPGLARGEQFTTVGISQLTTSRQHVGTPVLQAVADGASWRLEGLCPWVTGADASDTLVTGAVLPDGQQMFFVVPTDASGLEIGPPLEMLALSGSRTAVVRLHGVRVTEAILPAAGGPRTGGLATTALALGAARASIELMILEAAARPALEAIVAGLRDEQAALIARLQQAATAGIEPADRDRLRAEATSLVVRAAQAAVTASKGAGFIHGHPAERLARESLFFLVWSCPQAVASAVLCRLAGVE